MPASSSSATSNGPISQKIETAEAVRRADDADTFEMQEGAVKRKWQGTDEDRKEMSQLGRVQELRVSSRIDGNTYNIYGVGVAFYSFLLT